MIYNINIYLQEREPFFPDLEVEVTASPSYEGQTSLTDEEVRLLLRQTMFLNTIPFAYFVSAVLLTGPDHGFYHRFYHLSCC